MEGDRRRRESAQRQRRAPRLPEGSALEPARRHEGRDAPRPDERRRHAAHADPRPGAPGARPCRRQRLRAPDRTAAPECARDRRLAGGGAFLGRGACPVARTREDDRHGLSRRKPRNAAPRRAARPRGDGDAHGWRLRARARHADPVAVRRARPALPVAEPRLRTARRGGGSDGAPGPPPPPLCPRARARPPPRPRCWSAARLALALRRRHLGRPPAVPVRAGRAPGRDLAPSRRLRAVADRRLQRRPRAVHHRRRPARGRRQGGLFTRELRRPFRVPPAGAQRPRDPRGRPGDDRPRASAGELSMFGLDAHIASFSDGTTLLVVLLVSVALGLRHASDPDHLAAVTALIASRRDRAAQRAAALGFTWGLGHATSLLTFGFPIVLYRAYLPEPVQRSAETAVGFLIVGLASLAFGVWYALGAQSLVPYYF